MFYEERPLSVVVTTVGDKYHTTINYSIEEVEGGFEVESVTVVTDSPLGEEHHSQVVSALVRAKYSIDDEIAIARQSYADVNDYMAYNAYVEKCKAVACSVLELTYTPSYSPTVAEVLSQLRELMRPYIVEVEDEVAVTVPALFDPWAAGIDVVAGERRYYNGEVWRCVQGHRTQADWTPDLVFTERIHGFDALCREKEELTPLDCPALWTKVSLDEWPEFVQPTGGHDVYMKDDKITFNGERYISKIDNNAWSPTAYPAGWQKQ